MCVWRDKTHLETWTTEDVNTILGKENINMKWQYLNQNINWEEILKYT